MDFNPFSSHISTQRQTTKRLLTSFSRRTKCERSWKNFLLFDLLLLYIVYAYNMKYWNFEVDWCDAAGAHHCFAFRTERLYVVIVRERERKIPFNGWNADLKFMLGLDFACPGLLKLMVWRAAVASRQNFIALFCPQHLYSKFPKYNLLRLQLTVSSTTKLRILPTMRRSF